LENAIAMAVFLTNCRGKHGKVIELITEPRGLAKATYQQLQCWVLQHLVSD